MANNSADFDDFVCRRCEEIIQTDSRHNILNQEILKLENILEQTFSEEQKKLFLECENKVIELFSHDEILIYKQGYKDAIIYKKNAPLLTHFFNKNT